MLNTPTLAISLLPLWLFFCRPEVYRVSYAIGAIGQIVLSGLSGKLCYQACPYHALSFLSGYEAIGQTVLSGLSGKLCYRGYRANCAVGALGQTALSGLSGKLPYLGYRAKCAIGMRFVLQATLPQ